MRGFTLVELLVVVAVIGILAAIAVPNFMNARLRSQVARVNADLNACATAVESYAIDHGRHPFYNNPADEVTAFQAASFTFLPVTLTTPAAYLSVLPIDPFPRLDLENSNRLRPYKYVHAYNQIYMNQSFDGEHIQIHLQNYSGRSGTVLWHIWSRGPDRDTDHSGTQYEISNGLLSVGDLSRFGP